MAKAKPAADMMDGLFSNTTPPAAPAAAPENRPKPATTPPQKGQAPARAASTGRPRAADLNPTDETKRKTYYVKAEHEKKIKQYALDNDMDESQVIRMLIDGLK